MTKLPPNTRVLSNGCLQFRKQYKGQRVVKTWPLRSKEQAIREVYDLLRKMSRNEDLLLELEHRMTVDEACDTYLQLHGPSLKKHSDGPRSKQPVYNLECSLAVIKKAWSGKFWDSLNYLDMRDFLTQFKTVATRMRYLTLLAHIFKSFGKWNRSATILKNKVKLPNGNPASEWRSEMKASEKRELPLQRVLSIEEWSKFKVHLSDRSREICEIALRRFLRMSDIKQISKASIRGEVIEGLQAKTGEPFKVPTLGTQPLSYDFTNFRREFHNAQVNAGMDYPKTHLLHFTVRDLRRTGATWAYRKTKDLVGISKMLGHTQITTTIRYLNIDDTDRANIARVMDEITTDTIELAKNLDKPTQILFNDRSKVAEI